MIDFEILQKRNIKEHNPNWTQVPDHSYKVLIIAALGKPPASYQ